MGKIEQIKGHILDQIRRQRLRPGEKIDSRTIFMDRFCCARATVDKAIGQLVEETVLTTRKGHGTFVSKPRKARASNQLVVVTPELDHYVYPQEVLYGLVENLHSGWRTRFYTYHQLRFPKTWNDCKAQRCVVFIMPDADMLSFVQEAQRLKIPHLVVYRDIPESPFVSIDNERSVIHLVDHLVAKGRTKIAFFGINESRYTFPWQRYAGYLKGLLTKRLQLNENWCFLGPKAARVPKLEQILAGDPLPDAIINVSEDLDSIIQAIHQRGLTIGNDLLLANFDELPADHNPYKIISLRRITVEVGQQAAKVLDPLLHHPAAPAVQHYIVADLPG